MARHSCFFPDSPQKSFKVIVTTAPTALGNVPMMFCVFVTTFLACHLVLDELSAMIGGHQGDSVRWLNRTHVVTSSGFFWGACRCLRQTVW